MNDWSVQVDARYAINVAKKYVSDIFESEGVFNIGLEEVTFNDDRDNWSVTIGFSRPWDRPHLGTIIPQREKRTYKIVDIGAGGQILGMRNRKSDDDF